MKNGVGSVGPSIDPAKCVKCGGCVEVCPSGVYVQNAELQMPEITRSSMCLACAQCMLRCPAEAILVPGFSYRQMHKFGRLPEKEEVADLIRSRRSLRSFKNQPISRDVLEQVISLAATAPSGHNDQSTAYTVVQNPETLKLIEQYTTNVIEKLVKVMRNKFMKPIVKMMLGNQYDAMVESLPFFEFATKEERSSRPVMLHDAPALIVFHGEPNRLAADIGAQLCIQNASIALSGMGLGSMYSGFVTNAANRDKRLLKILKLPVNHRVFGVLAVGFPKTPFSKWVEKKAPMITWL